METSRVVRKSIEDYRGNWKKCLVIGLYSSFCMAIYTWICSYLSIIGMPLVSLIVTFLYPIVTIGISYAYLILIRKENKSLNETLSVGFKNPVKVAIINFIVILFSLLWTLLLIVPGIMKGFAYSQANFIYLDNSKLKSTEYLSDSSDLMENNKMELFLLGFLLYAIPYLITTFMIGFLFSMEMSKTGIVWGIFLKSIYFIVLNIFISPLYGLIYANFYSFLADGDDGAGETKSIWNAVVVVSLIIMTILSLILFMRSLGY